MFRDGEKSHFNPPSPLIRAIITRRERSVGAPLWACPPPVALESGCVSPLLFILHPTIPNEWHTPTGGPQLLSLSLQPFFSHHANWRNKRGVIRCEGGGGWTGSSSTRVMTIYAAVQHLSDTWGPRMRRRAGRGLALMMRPFDCKCAFHLWHWTAWQRQIALYNRLEGISIT